MNVHRIDALHCGVSGDVDRFRGALSISITGTYINARSSEIRIASTLRRKSRSFKDGYKILFVWS